MTSRRMHTCESNALKAKLRDWRTSTLLFVFAAGPFAALLIGLSKPPNIAALALMAIPFTGCVILVPAAQLPKYNSLAAWVFLFGFLLNMLYELAHSPLYTHVAETGYTYPKLVTRLLAHPSRWIHQRDPVARPHR
ncbi:MAG: hypothetical protein MUQ10_15205, partial [Anaerolineae bacterium]|nr:hypothetical protein [Anaerolineae bacterium]